MPLIDVIRQTNHFNESIAISSLLSMPNTNQGEISAMGEDAPRRSLRVIRQTSVAWPVKVVPRLRQSLIKTGFTPKKIFKNRAGGSNEHSIKERLRMCTVPLGVSLSNAYGKKSILSVGYVEKVLHTSVSDATCFSATRCVRLI